MSVQYAALVFHQCLSWCRPIKQNHGRFFHTTSWSCTYALGQHQNACINIFFGGPLSKTAKAYFFVQSDAKVTTFSIAVLGNETRVKTRKHSPTLGKPKFSQIGLRSFQVTRQLFQLLGTQNSFELETHQSLETGVSPNLEPAVSNFKAFVPAFRNRKFLKLGIYSSEHQKHWFQSWEPAVPGTVDTRFQDWKALVRMFEKR